MNRKIVTKLVQDRRLQHLLFWILSFYILLRLFAYSNELGTADLVYTFLFHIGLWPGIYLNLFILIPRLLRNKRYLLYFASFLTVYLTSIYFHFLIFNHLADFLFPGFYFISDFEFGDIAQYLGVYLISTTLLKLSKAWFKVQEQQHQIEILKNEKTQNELVALKAQIHPHALFNSLNNLYSLALEKHPEVPKIILKLSENLRYMLYEVSERFVPLAKEIELLKNYLDLQKLGLVQPEKIQFKITGAIQKQKIAPLLLLPLIENSIKHGLKGDPYKAYIDIRLQIENNYFSFYIENNQGEPDQIIKQENEGLGLKNIQRRLALLYPKKHQFQLSNLPDKFIVNLQIDLYED